MLEAAKMKFEAEEKNEAAARMDLKIAAMLKAAAEECSGSGSFEDE